MARSRRPLPQSARRFAQIPFAPGKRSGAAGMPQTLPMAATLRTAHARTCPALADPAPRDHPTGFPSPFFRGRAGRGWQHRNDRAFRNSGKVRQPATTRSRLARAAEQPGTTRTLFTRAASQPARFAHMPPVLATPSRRKLTATAAPWWLGLVAGALARATLALNIELVLDFAGIALFCGQS